MRGVLLFSYYDFYLMYFETNEFSRKKNNRGIFLLSIIVEKQNYTKYT